MPDKINLLRPDGKLVGVPKEHLASYLLLGYREISEGENFDRLTQSAEEDYYSGGVEQAKAFGEGIVSGLTMGASDIVGADEASFKRGAYNPGTRLGGEILGVVLPAAITGGEALATQATAKAGVKAAFGRALSKTPAAVVSRASTAAGEKLAGRGILGKAVGSGIEGAAYGASAEVRNAALTGDPLTVEGVLAGAGIGLAFGGAIGAGAGAVEAGAARVLAKRAQRIEEETLAAMQGTKRVDLPWEYTRDRRLYKTEAPPNPFPKAATEAEARSMASEGILPADAYAPFRAAVRDLRSVSKRLVNEAEAAHEAAVKLGKKADKGHIVAPAPDRVGEELYAEGLAAGFKTGEGVSYKSQASAMRAQWGHLQRAMKKGDAKKIADQVSKYQSKVTELQKAMGKAPAEAIVGKSLAKSVKEMAELKFAVDELDDLLPSTADELFAMGPEKAERLFAATEAAIKAKSPEAKAVTMTLRGAVDSLAEKAGVASKEAGTIGNLRAAWAAGSAARESAGKGWVANKTFVPKVKMEYTEPLKISEGVGSKYKNPSSVYPSSAKKAKKVKLSDEVDNSGASFVKQYLVRRAMGAAVGGLFGNQFGTAESATGAIVGALLAGKGATLGRVREAAAKIALPTAKASRKVGPKVTPLAYSVAGREDPGKNVREAFAKRSKEIRALALDAKNQAFMAAMSFQADGHPEFAKGLYEAANRIQAVLAERLPKDPPGTRWGTEYLWHAPAEQIAVFEQEYQAVADPASFVEQAVLAPGSIFPSAVDAFATAWPTLYAEFRTNALYELALRGTEKISTGDLAAISVLLKAQVAPHMTPEFIQDQVAIFSAENQPPQPQPQTGGQPGRPPGANPEATRAQVITNR